MIRKLLLAAAIAVSLYAPTWAADKPPQTFADEQKATSFCKEGNVVWYNPDSKIYFERGNRYYNNTKKGGYTCRTQAEKAGYRASKN